MSPGAAAFEPDRDLYPFESRWFASSVGPVHYVDEGPGDGPEAHTGRPLLLLHGNPDWSFLYRHLIGSLRDRFRCIALDYPGFGLSVHPAESYGYTAAEHAVVVRELVEHLDLRDLVVMGQDWGGPIGMDVASRLPDRVSGLVMGNTWFWPAEGPVMHAFSLVMGSPPLQALIVRRNFFVDVLMRRTLQVRLSDEEFRHYQAVVPTPESRRGIAVLPRQIREAGPWLADVERRVKDTLADTPLLLVWGMKDPAFGRSPVLARWKAVFPSARVVRLPEAGHYLQEDAPDRVAEEIVRSFAG